MQGIALLLGALAVAAGFATTAGAAHANVVVRGDGLGDPTHSGTYQFDP
jgi:hypothetical protein